MRKKALILGVSGQDGAYLAHFLNRKGYALHGSTRDPSAATFQGLERLGLHGKIEIHRTDLSDFTATCALVREIAPDEIYHLAGQSSVGLSFVQPADTIVSIATTTLNLLESVRTLKIGACIFNAASSECYGHCETPACEGSAFHPKSPYAVARVAAFWIAANYRDAYGMFVATGILSNHESPLRSDRFVTRKIVQAVKRIAEGSGETLKLGNLNAQRDWGWAPEFVPAYWSILQASRPDDYNIATGETNALSDFVREAFSSTDLDWQSHVSVDTSLARAKESHATRIDVSKIGAELGWRARYKMRDVVKFLLDRERDGGVGPIP